MNFVVVERRLVEHEHQRVLVFAHAVFAVPRRLRATRSWADSAELTRRSRPFWCRAPASSSPRPSRRSRHGYNYLFGVALFGAIIVWIIILVSHLSFRRRHGLADLPVRMPLFPWPQIIGARTAGGVLVTMAFDRGVWGISWIVGVPWLVLIYDRLFRLASTPRDGGIHCRDLSDGSIDRPAPGARSRREVSMRRTS